LATSLSDTWTMPLPLGFCAPMVMRRMASSRWRREAHDHREIAVAAVLVEVARRLAADRRLDGGVDVARREAIARGAGAVDVDAHRRLAQRIEHGEVGDPRHRLHRVSDPRRGLLEQLKIVAEELDRVLAFDAGRRLLDVCPRCTARN
jgi:hypothetical protein